MTTTVQQRPQEGARATRGLSDLRARWGPRLSFLAPLAGLVVVQRLLFPAPLGVVVNGALVGGSVGMVRALSAAVRGVQSGYLRSYALLLVTGFAGLALYFLLQSS